MTRPKSPPHRLGFSQQRDRTHADVEEFARQIFLQYTARMEPRVLATLAEVPADRYEIDVDLDALAQWAERWHLTDPWCLAYARGTWRFWQTQPTAQRIHWADRDDAKGKLYQERPGRQAPRPD